MCALVCLSCWVWPVLLEKARRRVRPLKVFAGTNHRFVPHSERTTTVMYTIHCIFVLLFPFRALVESAGELDAPHKRQEWPGFVFLFSAFSARRARVCFLLFAVEIPCYIFNA
jgi:hypothetical protein